MKDKIETYLAATIAAGMVLSPAVIIIEFVGFLIEFISIL